MLCNRTPGDCYLPMLNFCALLLRFVNLIRVAARLFRLVSFNKTSAIHHVKGKWLSTSWTITSVWAGSILMARSLTEVIYLWLLHSNLDSHDVPSCSETVNVSCKLLLVIALLRSSSCSPSSAGNMVVHISFAAHVGWCNFFFFLQWPASKLITSRCTCS